MGPLTARTQGKVVVTLLSHHGQKIKMPAILFDKNGSSHSLWEPPPNLTFPREGILEFK